jgi:negative regulator of flagellin synthesis FlgM
MRIDPNQPVSSQAIAERSGRASGKKSDASGASAEGATFSAGSSNVASLTAQALTAPEIRQDRVEALREAIRNGSYQIDPGNIAEAMLNETGR